MKFSTLIIGLALLASASPSYAGGIMMMGGGASSGGASCADSSCTGFLVCQNFEGTGYDNSETWTEDAGTPDEDYGTALRGSQSLQLASGEVTYKTFTEQTDVWAHFLFRTDALSDNDYFVNFGGADRIVSSDGTIRISNGANAASSDTGVMAANTTYHVFIHVTPTAKSYYVSTSATCPDTATVTLTDTMSSVSEIRLQSTTANRVYDQVIVSTTKPSPVCSP